MDEERYTLFYNALNSTMKLLKIKQLKTLIPWSISILLEMEGDSKQKKCRQDHYEKIERVFTIDDLSDKQQVQEALRLFSPYDLLMLIRTN